MLELNGSLTLRDSEKMKLVYYHIILMRKQELLKTLYLDPVLVMQFDYKTLVP
jgi:hypothetical protein